MRRFASFLTVIALAASIAGCFVPQGFPQGSDSTTTASEVSSETSEATATSEATVITTEPETSGSSSADASINTDDYAVLDDVEAPVFEPMEIDLETADRGRIIPFVTGYVENRWMKENNKAYLSFITLDGEIINSEPFDHVIYCEEEGVYIVRKSVYGLSKYGFLSDDGALFTGLIYDGAAEASGYKKDGVCFYGTNYEDGKLWVSSLDNNLNVISTDLVTIDEDEISLAAWNAQLSVLYIDRTSAVLINRNVFYYKTMLVDRLSGKLLYDDSSSGFRDPVIFGNVIVEVDTAREGVAVYDMSGKQLLDDRNAYVGMVTDDLFMVARNNKIVLYDTDWQAARSIDYPAGSVVMTSFGHIAVADGSVTLVYDKDLNLINTLDYSADTGTYLRDWHNYGEGDMYYDTIVGVGKIINLNTGAVLVEEDRFFYEFAEGYIVADNQSYAHLDTEKWRIYDKDLNLIRKGEGGIEVISDEVTGDVYMIIDNDNLLTVYSLPDCMELFSFYGNSYTLEAIDGRFHCWDTDGFILLDSSGEVITASGVDYARSG